MRRTRFNKEFNILACDPSLTAWGYAIIDLECQVREAGCIKTAPENKKRKIRKGDDSVRRVSEINNMLQSLIEQYHINYILTELPHGSQNASAARMIGYVVGMLQTWSDSLNIGIEWYSENDVKKYLFGRGSVTKTEMIEKIKTKLNVNWYNIKYKDEAIADALGIYLTALDKSSALKLFIKTRKDDANDY
jgi:Holliday junction resolvasome RuvABC endonuclease subunit